MFLLHLSILREYLDLEFQVLHHSLPFGYDLERIIDDFILMAFFVGNDFLPHLPGLHINEGAFEHLWGIYKNMLPTAGGYLNEHGAINMTRLQIMLDKLADYEKENFAEAFANENWYRGRQEKEVAAIEKARKRGKLIITKDQSKLLDQIKQFVKQHESKPSSNDRLAIVNTLPGRDRTFVQELADSLHLRCTWDEVDDYGQSLIVLSFDVPAEEDGGEADAAENEEEADGEWESEEDIESKAAINRVLDKYSKAKVIDNELEDFEESFEETLKQKMVEHKRKYYKEKLEIDFDNPKSLHPIIYRYIEGLQWVLNYYYKGVPSWGWFYDYHYAPMISDLKDIASMKFELKTGKPFLPFQQLMGVLPADSQEHVPDAYRDLMNDETSPIYDFYPRKFDLDLNGKKMDWEAVVKIPFIDEERLLKAMAARDQRLTPEERKRNTSGELPTQFVYDADESSRYTSSLPGFFPDLVASHAKVQPFHMPTLGEGAELQLGLIDGVHLGASALAGFPSLHTLPFVGSLGYHGVSVFQQDSRNQSMIITITGKHDKGNAEAVAKAMLGQRTFHNWPYLHEGIVAGVSDDMCKYELQQVGQASKIVSKPHDHWATVKWKKEADRIEYHYSKRLGVIIGHVDVVLHIRPLKGLKRLDDGSLIKDYEEEDKEVTQAIQMNVNQVTFEDERYLEKDAPPLEREFPKGEKIIFLGQLAYGTAARVLDTSNNALDIGVAYFQDETRENHEFTRCALQRASAHYHSSYNVARRLGLNNLAVSRITSTLMVQLKNSKTNIGLSIKFESKGLKVLGYSRKNDKGWEFSEKCVQVLEKYKAAFPEPFRNLDKRGHELVTAAELCPSSDDPDATVKAMHKWLQENGVADLEPVSLFAEQLDKECVMQLEHLADHFRQNKTMDNIKRAKLQGIPRHAVLKPSHAIYRLQGQRFMLGDRVIMVQDGAAGGVPLAMNGVVVGLGTRDIDVVWDVPFMGGETLGGRCSDYRGSTVPFAACLNLTRPQFVVRPQNAPQAVGHQAPFQPQLGPRPAVAPQNYRPAVPAKNPVSIVPNPRRGQAGQLNYGGAAKGVRPPTAQMANLSHHDKLQTALLGQPRQFTAKVPSVRPVSPTQLARGLPQNGHGHNGAPMRGGHAHRGRGGHGGPHATPHVPHNGHDASRGGRGRGGRGRGRGGPAGVVRPPAATAPSAAAPAAAE